MLEDALQAGDYSNTYVPGAALRQELVIGGRYVAKRLLADAPGTKTFLATDPAGDRRVVVKTRAIQALSHDVRTRLEQECLRLRELCLLTPRPLLEVGHDGGNLFIVRPFVEGRTLKSRMKHRRLDLRETLRIGICLTEALRDLHRHRTLHRNIKPSNVLVDSGDQISTATLVDIGLTQDNVLSGSTEHQSLETAFYASPEMAGSVDVGVGEPSDLYSVGVLLYECLAGQLPFQGDTVGEVLFQHMTSPVPEIQVGNVGISAAIQDLFQRLLRKDLGDRYQSAEGVLSDLRAISLEIERGNTEPAVIVGGADRRCNLTEPAFVGRKDELARIDAEIEQACSGQARLVLVEGESGSGKTRFLNEVARRAGCNGMWTLRGQTYDDVDLRPFQLLDGVVTDFIATVKSDQDAATPLLDQLDDHRAGIAAAFPRLAKELEWDASSPDQSGALGVLRMAKSLAHFLHALGTEHRPAIVILDNVQWSDELSVELFEHWTTLQNGRDASILVLLSFRSENVGEDHPIRQLRASTHLRLGPLPAPDVRRLAESMAGPLPEQVFEVVQRLSDGSPFMVSAVLRGLVESGAMVSTARKWEIEPLAIADLRSSNHAGSLLSSRIDRLPDHTKELLNFGAVLGIQFDLETAAHLANQAKTDAEQALDIARRRQLVWLRGDCDQCVFVHERIRSVLLNRLSDEQREKMHRAAATYLEEIESTRLADLTYHFDAAGESAKVVEQALDVANEARARHSLEIAEQQYRIAQRGAAEASGAIRFRIAVGLGEVLSLRGDCDAAEELCEQAAQYSRGQLAQAQVLGMFGKLAYKRGDIGQSVQRTEEALKALGYRVPRNRISLWIRASKEVAVQLSHTLVPHLTVHRRKRLPSEAERLSFRLLSQLGHGYWFTRSRIAVLWAHLRGMNLTERYPPTAELAQAYSEHAPVLALTPWHSRGVAYARKSLEIQRSLGNQWGEGQSLCYEGLALFAASWYEECVTSCRQALRLLQRNGDRWLVHVARFQISSALYRLGDLSGALEEAQRHHALGVAVGDEQSSGVSLDIWARASEGRVPHRLLETELGRDRNDRHSTIQVLLAKGTQQFHLGNVHEAVAALEQAIQIADETKV